MLDTVTNGQLTLMAVGSRALYGESDQQAKSSAKSVTPRDDVIRPPKPFKEMTAMEYMSWMDMVSGGLV